MKLLNTIIGLLLFGTVFGQDYHYSQQFAVPMLLNPAMTGYVPCEGRVSAQYRNQWASVSNAYQTTSATYEHKTLDENPNINGFAGVGLSLYNDQSGIGQLRQTSVALSAAYHFFLNDDNQFISVGGQFGVGQQAVGRSFTYDSQFDGRTFNASLSSGEVPMNATRVFLDGGFGASYTMQNRLLSLNIGVGMFHLNKPDVSLIASEISLLPRRLVLHGNIEFPLGNPNVSNVSFIGRAVHQRQGSFAMTNIGGLFKLNLSSSRQPVFRTNNAILYAGLMYRWNDAAVAMVKMQLGQIGFGVSYDFTTSEFIAASRAQGGFELALTYDFGDCKGSGQGCPIF